MLREPINSEIHLSPVHAVRSRRSTLVLALAFTVAILTGCTATTAGQAVKAAPGADSDGAVVALMNTGAYRTTAWPPFGPAGTDRQLQNDLEAQRLAVNVIGPWQVDAKLTFRPPLENTLLTAPHPDSSALTSDGLFTPDLAGIAANHGYKTGFSTMRVSDPALPQRGLINAVLMFPDAPSASAAATEMAARAPLGEDPTRPIEPYGHPEALARAVDHPDGSTTAVSFLAHDRYVLYQWAHTPPTALAPGATPADLLIKSAASTQADVVDRFTPTDPTKLADLPKDPTGQLLAQTLTTPDNHVPAIIGAWQPTAWLHFEDNPLTATPLFTQTSVSAVAQRTTTVYQTSNTHTATQLTDTLAAQIATQPDVDPTDGVPGLPTAKCFTRPKETSSTEATMSVARIFWHYKCVGRADRYAYTAVSGNEEDVKQQMAAQYRILAGV